MKLLCSAIRVGNTAVVKESLLMINKAMVNISTDLCRLELLVLLRFCMRKRNFK